MSAITDLTSPEAVKRFQASADRFTTANTQSKEAAIKVLFEAGIYTKGGNLTKNYQS